MGGDTPKPPPPPRPPDTSAADQAAAAEAARLRRKRGRQASIFAGATAPGTAGGQTLGSGSPVGTYGG